jgi:hypothetical protein
LTFTANDCPIVLIFDITVLKRGLGQHPSSQKCSKALVWLVIALLGHNMLFCLVLFLSGQGSVLSDKWEASESQGSD